MSTSRKNNFDQARNGRRGSRDSAHPEDSAGKALDRERRENELDRLIIHLCTDHRRRLNALRNSRDNNRPLPQVFFIGRQREGSRLRGRRGSERRMR